LNKDDAVHPQIIPRRGRHNGLGMQMNLTLLLMSLRQQRFSDQHLVEL
jgi:hypothetical protein